MLRALMLPFKCDKNGNEKEEYKHIYGGKEPGQGQERTVHHVPNVMGRLRN